MDIARTIIIGNSGSGKSWLAQRLAQKTGAVCLDLDDVYWVGAGYQRARERAEAIALANACAAQQRWIIEGVYGWLAAEVLARATALIWLCPAEAECVANIHGRGPRGNASTASFADLLQWASTYRTRTGSSAYAFHQKLFDDFTGARCKLQSRQDMQTLLERVPA